MWTPPCRCPPGRYLEFVAPTDAEAAVRRWLAKIGGRGGYVLSVQHPDPDAVKARALASGIRVPIDAEAFGHRIIQLHPQDVGLLLELDGIADRQAWFWDDIDPGPEPDAAVSDIVGVEVPVADPAATTAQWHALLDLGEPGAESDRRPRWVLGPVRAGRSLGGVDRAPQARGQPCRLTGGGAVPARHPLRARLTVVAMPAPSSDTVPRFRATHLLPTGASAGR